MRRVLLLGSAVNIAGAVTFAPPVPWGRHLLGLPPAEPLYLWMISAWVVAFGVSFARQASTGIPERGVLALAAFGKLSFGALILVWLSAGQVSWLAIVAALIDGVLATTFLVWLWRSRADRDVVNAEPSP